MDDNRDKETMRNQLIAIVLMTVLFVAWFKWFMPTPQPKKPVPAPQQQAQTQAPKKPAPKEAPKSPATTPGGFELPPIPTITDPVAEEVTIGNDHIELVFTRIGGRLKRATVLLGKDSVQLVPTASGPDTEVIYPLGLRFAEEQLGDALDWRRFDAERDPSGKAVTFSLTVPTQFTLRKHFSLGEKPNLIEARVEYENIEDKPRVLGMDQTPAYVLAWGPDVHSGDIAMGIKQSLMWYKEGRDESLAITSMTAGANGEAFLKTVPGAEWIAVRSAYFVVAFKPDFEGSLAWASGAPKDFRFGLAVPRFEAAPKTVQSNAFEVYVGPSEQKTLAEGWKTLPTVLRFFSPPWTPLDSFAKLLLRILNWFHTYVIANYGLAIIFLTILVRLGMYPLTLKSMKSMKKMQLLGPEMEELKAKYKDDAQELNKKMMELYKGRGVNPLGGCLPMVLQMPVFIALYRMLWSAFELRGAPFYGWITDLSQPDKLMALPFMAQVPFLGATFHHLNILPILMGLSMLVSQKVMPVSGPAQNQQQKMMMYFMPVFFSFMCYNMASGLNLYIFTSTVLGMVQQKFTRVSTAELQTKKKETKRQHFYTAAQARKRHMAREAKKDTKRDK